MGKEGKDEMPTLHIRKDAERDRVFYYDRTERHRRTRADVSPRKRGGLLRGNRSLLIVFLDLVVITLILLSLKGLGLLDRSSAVVGGYRCRLTAVRIGDEVHVRMEIGLLRGKTRADDSKDEAPERARESGGTRVFVRFWMEGAAEQFAAGSAVAPAVEGAGSVLRIVLPAVKEARSNKERVIAEVSVGSQRRRLSTAVR